MAGTAGQRGAAAVQELVAPGGDRGLRDLLAAGRLLDRDLAVQHGEHDADPVVNGLDRWSAQQDSFTDRSGAKFRLSQES
jgi:hypothetical protein